MSPKVLLKYVSTVLHKRKHTIAEKYSNDRFSAGQEENIQMQFLTEARCYSLSSQGNKLLKLCPYKIRAAKQLCPPNLEAKGRYPRWYEDLVTNGFLVFKFRFPQMGHCLH